jgi:uncharacterized membrane protein YgcG
MGRKTRNLNFFRKGSLFNIFHFAFLFLRIVQIWAEGAVKDLTYFLISTLNGTIVCYRHRKSGVLYMSAGILGPQKAPTLARILVALQVAAIRDCMGRAGAEGRDGSQTPKLPGDGLGSSGGEGQERSSGMDGEDGGGGKGGGGSESTRKRKRGGTETATASYDVDGISAPFAVS